MINYLNRTFNCKKMKELKNSIYWITLIMVGTFFQQKYNIIYLGESNTYLTLVIGILTLYGIYYVFIQFSLNYALQIKYDKYWGKSKTKLLITGSREYKFFNSEIFKYILLFSTIAPILNNKTSNLVNFIQYKEWIKALWNINIAIIFIVYILLFVRSVRIMKRLFDMQEHKDTSYNFLITYKIKEEYKELFKDFYKNKETNFIQYLIYDTSDLNLNERKSIIIYVLDNLSYYLDEINDYRTEDNQKFYYLKRMFFTMWDEIKKLELTFTELLEIFKIQNSIIYSEINRDRLEKSNNQQIKEISEFFEKDDMLFSRKYINLDRNLYFDIPEIIWDKIDNSEETEELYYYITNRELERDVIYRASSSKLTEYENLLLEQYKKITLRILDKYLQNKDISNIDVRKLFRIGENIRLDSMRQNLIYLYIINLQYNEKNKKQISILVKLLDYKFKVTIIFYMMFYTGSDSYSSWKGDVIFLRSILANEFYTDNKIETEEVIEFICKNIEKSNIGHRINSDLIEWTIKNINKKIDNEVIKECINIRYMNYFQLLKFKYIFNENRYYINVFDFSNIKLQELTESLAWDWRIEFQNEILRKPYLLKENFFFEHQNYFYEYFIEADMPEIFYESEDFRTFYINMRFELSEEKLMALIDNKSLLGKGLFEFLILKIGEKSYQYLLTNIKITDLLKDKFRRIINNNGNNIKEYVDELVNRADECLNKSIPDLEKENIVIALNKLIFN